MQTIFGMGLFLLWILTLAFAASIDEDGTILDRGPLGSLFAVKIAMQRLDQRKEQLVFSHAAAIINGCGFKSISRAQFSRVE